MLPRRRKTLSREGTGFAFPKWEPEEAQAGWSALDGASLARAGKAILQRRQGTTLGKTVLQVSQMTHCPQTAGPWACGERWRLFALAEPARRVWGCCCCEGCLSSCPKDKKASVRSEGVMAMVKWMCEGFYGMEASVLKEIKR